MRTDTSIMEMELGGAGKFFTYVVYLHSTK